MSERFVGRLQEYVEQMRMVLPADLCRLYASQVQGLLARSSTGTEDPIALEREFVSLTQEVRAQQARLMALNEVVSQTYQPGERVWTDKGPGTVSSVVHEPVSGQRTLWLVTIHLDQGGMLKGTKSGSNIRRIVTLSPEERLRYDLEVALAGFMNSYTYEHLESPDRRPDYDRLVTDALHEPSIAALLAKNIASLRDKYPTTNHSEQSMLDRTRAVVAFAYPGKGRAFLASMRKSLWGYHHAVQSLEEFPARALKAAATSIHPYVEGVYVDMCGEEFRKAKKDDGDEGPSWLPRRRTGR